MHYWQNTMLVLYTLLVCAINTACHKESYHPVSTISLHPYTQDNRPTFNPYFQSLTETADNISLRIEGCASGYSEVFNFTGQLLKLYNHDKNCQAAIDSFTLEGELFIMPNSGFLTDVGSVNEFTTLSGRKASVLVVEQLTDPLDVLGESVKFAIQELKNGDDTSIKLTQNVLVIEALQSIVTEGLDSSIPIRVFKIAEDSPAEVHLTLQVVSAAAKNGEDYSVKDFNIVIPENKIETTFDIPLVNDSIPEYNELLFVSLAEDPNIIFYSNAHVLIQDDDSTFPKKDLILHHAPNTLHGNLGDKVSSWADLSSTGQQTAQSTIDLQPTFVEEGGYYGLHFSGPQMFTLENSVQLNLDSFYEEKTFHLMLKTSADVSSRQVIFEQGGGTKGLNLYIENSNIYFSGWNKSGQDETTPWSGKYTKASVAANTLYHVTGVYSFPERKIKLYINAELKHESLGVGRLFKHTGAIGLGGMNGKTLFVDNSTSGANFSGDLYEIAMYNSTHTDLDILGMGNFFLEKYKHIIPELSLSSTAVEIGESDGASFDLELQLSSPTITGITIPLSLSGTATHGEDYTLSTLSISFAPFEIHKNIPITILDDSLVEADETIVVEALEGEHYILGSPVVVQTNLYDNETLPIPERNLWLRSDQAITLVKDAVSYWEDQSIFQNDAFQETKSKMPLYPTGEINEVFFDNKNFMYIDSSTELNEVQLSELSLFGVVKVFADIQSRQVIYESGTEERGYNIVVESGSLFFTAWNVTPNGGTAWGPISISLPIPEQSLIPFLMTWSSIDDSLKIQTNTHNHTLSVESHTIDLITGLVSLGRAYSGTRYHDGSRVHNGDIFSGSLIELQVFNTNLDEKSQDFVWKNLLNRYGL